VLQLTKLLVIGMFGVHGAADQMAIMTSPYVGAVLFDIRRPVTGFAVCDSPDS
jgi:hypothetical protein